MLTAALDPWFPVELFAALKTGLTTQDGGADHGGCVLDLELTLHWARWLSLRTPRTVTKV